MTRLALRSSVLWITVVSLTIGFGRVAMADPPAPNPSLIPPAPAIPRDQSLSNRADPAIERIIRALSDSEANADAPGLLGDVLDIIRQRGSILDGSVLDPKLDKPPEFESPKALPLRAQQPPELAEHESVNQLHESRSDQSVQSQSRDHNSNANDQEDRLAVAESLLQTARQLESLSNSNPGRAGLVLQMRTEATAILAGIYSTSSDDAHETQPTL